MNIKNIPVEVMDAAHKHIPLYSKHQVQAERPPVLCLPLPTEARDE